MTIQEFSESCGTIAKGRVAKFGEGLLGKGYTAQQVAEVLEEWRASYGVPARDVEQISAHAACAPNLDRATEH